MKPLKVIELLRERMNQESQEKGIHHPEVLRLSQILDQALNQLEKNKVS